MLRYIIILISLSCYSNFAISQENNVINNSVVWRVTKEGLKDTSYLFGTYHAFSYHFFEYYPRIIELLIQTKAVVTESPYIKFDTSLINVPDSNKWTNFATKEQYRTIRYCFNKILRIPHTLIKNTDIYTIYELFDYYAYEYFIKKRYYIKPSPTLIDEYCAERAYKYNLEIYGLEDIYLHQSYLQTIVCNCKNPTIAQKKQKVTELDSVIKVFRKNPNNYPNDTALIRDYFEMKLDYQLDTVPEESEINNNIRTRNLLWIDKIDSLINQKSSFIVVGVYHLYFKFGLINLLKNLGYKVETIDVIKFDYKRDRKLRRLNF